MKSKGALMIGSFRCLTIGRGLLAAAAASFAATALASPAGAVVGPPTPAPGISSGSSICDPSQWPASTNPANPLDLPSAPPAGDPLTGAQFFVPGPTHGMAAGALAQLLGIDPSSLPNNLSFSSFWSELSSNPTLASKLASNPSLKAQVNALAKIAAQPEAQRLSLYSGGGGPGAIEGQTQKILCSNMTADPGTIPILETFFIYPNGAYCPSLDALSGNTGTFKRQVTEFAQGIANHPAVVLTELDSIGSAACMNSPSGTGHTVYKWVGSKRHRHLLKYFVANPPQGARLALWTSDLAFEIAQLERYAPNTVIYTEGGYSDGNAPQWTAQMLNMVLSSLQADGGSAARLRGFFTNDTHENWAANEVVWGNAVSNALSGLTHGAYRAHFVVNTADDGQGPDVPASRVKGGNEILCNPPNRGLGIPDNTAPGSLLTGGPGLPAGTPSYVDAFLWVHTPARSSGTCNGGPAPGVFWPARAVQMAQLANAQLGPGWAIRPY